MLGAGTVDDHVGRLERSARVVVDDRQAGAPRDQIVQSGGGHVSALRRGGTITGLLDQKNVLDFGGILRRGDLRFAEQYATVLFPGDQEQVLAVGNVQQPGFELVEFHTRIDGGVEVASFAEVGAGKEDLPKRAVCEVEPVSDAFLLEGVVKEVSEERAEHARLSD